MTMDRRFGAGLLAALPFIALALAAIRPLHDVPGHAAIGAALFVAALASLWRVAGAALARGEPAARLGVLAGTLLLAPWLLIGLLWTGLGAPFQASTPDNQQRFLLLMVDAIVAGAGFVVLRDALAARGERVFGSLLRAAAIPASGLYVVCIAITLAHATMALQGEHVPVPAIVGHLYDALEFFACLLTYVATALAAAAMQRAGLLGRGGMRAFVVVCAACVVLLVLRGVEFPEISGQVAPWWTQPGVIVRIPAIPWLMPGLLGALLLRRAGAQPT